ncbi:hypothetical protein SBF1_5380005 [Candidatus Desulfosporosinus infrequens]|uniref:Uncharacterized protein n=1 Tax=Candidatus Desulfosporosinus infrequens TaxID=2043169 RepID=A0A2U3LIR7_9FIRM|nr:hypothetical protein SBF1_5380005 [Candidatus Desulfosporosinus infrequens]
MLVICISLTNMPLINKFNYRAEKALKNSVHYRDYNEKTEHLC